MLGFSPLANGKPIDDDRTKSVSKVILDTDMGLLSDDAIALFMLANSSNIEVLGLTTVAGNSWVEEGVAYSLRNLEIVDRRDIPVFFGAGAPLMGSRLLELSADGILYGSSRYVGMYSRPQPKDHTNVAIEPYHGYAELQPSNEYAVDFIVRTILANPNEVTILAIGPTTNIAMAVKKDPRIAPLTKQIIYMGGAINVPGNSTPAAEFNWWFDPESTKICLRAPFPKQIVVSLDLAERVLLTKAEFDQIATADKTPITKMIVDLRASEWDRFPDRTTPVWDVIVAAVTIDPNIVVKSERVFLDIDTNKGLNFGRSVAYPVRSNSNSGRQRLTPPRGTQQIEVLLEIDHASFWKMYVDVLTARIRS